MPLATPPPDKRRLVGRAVNKKVGLTVDDLRAFIAIADQDGYPGDTPITEPRTTWRGRLHQIVVAAVTR
jgi:hypothetical protein